jgi:hypothetical protein
MKKTLLIILALALAIPFTFVMAFAGNLEDPPGGTLSGGHYNLNLLGKTTCPGDDLKGTNRHTIMVKLYFTDVDPNNTVGDNPGNIVNLDKTNKIFLKEGPFQVLDGNACDGDGALFQLPANSDPGEDGIWGTSDDVIYGAAYEVYVRELGKPGGTGDLRTCGIDEGPDGLKETNDDEVVCSSENVLLVRGTGGSKFRNVTKELTSMVIQIDTDGDTDLETVRIPIFDSTLYRYFWDYDNNGLRLVQLRFYPVQ